MKKSRNKPNPENDRNKKSAPQSRPRQRSEPSAQKRQNKPSGHRQKSIGISVVVPLLNEEESLPELSLQLEKVLPQIVDNYEVIFVDDGSTDNSFKVLRQINKRNNKFKAIRFRRNYGKSAALSAGFQRAKGRYVITMDADLQDDPFEIPALIETLNDGFDLVSGWKKKRKDPLSKRIPSKFFNWVTSKASGIRLHDFNCGLKAYKKDVVKSLEVYGEMHRYLPALAHWMGFNVTEQVVQHHPRRFGRTKFGISRFIKGYLDLVTVLFTTRFLKRPLHFFGAFGSLFVLVGLGIDIYLTIEWFLGLTSLSNRPLALLGVALIIVGVQFISMGLLGEMIVKTSKTADPYSVKEFL